MNWHDDIKIIYGPKFVPSCWLWPDGFAWLLGAGASASAGNHCKRAKSAGWRVSPAPPTSTRLPRNWRFSLKSHSHVKGNEGGPIAASACSGETLLHRMDREGTTLLLPSLIASVCERIAISGIRGIV